MFNWTYRRKEPPKKKAIIDPLLKEEQKILLNFLTGQRKNLIQFALWSGLRTSELIALRWNDIDWIKGEIDISKVLTNGSDDDEDPKTFSSIRKVKLLTPARSALISQKKFTLLENDFVFHNPETNTRWRSTKNIRTFWLKALKSTGIRYRKPYQTRHTYASMMLSSGEHPMWVAKQMGHKDWTMIVKTYGRWMPDADKLAGQRAEKVYGLETNKTGYL